MGTRHPRPSIAALFALLCALGLALAAAAGRQEPDAPAAPPAPAAAEAGAGSVYELARAASVEVLVAGRQEGSGWFADPDGLVVTAAHVVRQAAAEKLAVEVVWPRTTRRMPAEVVALDRGHDLALLRVARGDQGYPFLRVAARVPPPGEDVFLFGAAYFRHEVLVRGSVARAEPTYEYFAAQKAYAKVYHVSAPSPPGTSGGCWLDADGGVVGNQCGFMTIDGAGAGIAMTATPQAIRRLLDDPRSPAVPTLGCAFEELLSQPAGLIARYPNGAGGLVPVLIAEGGAAARAGLSDQTLITALDGRPVQWRDELLEGLYAKRPGDRVTLRVLGPNGAAARDVEITVEALD
jgi:S1-C subfamily serine protease